MADEGADRKTSSGNGSDPADPGKIAAQADETREHLDQLIAELDRRRHAATDLSEQMERHPVVLLAGAAVTVGLLVGLAVLGARRRRSRRALPGRMQRLGEAVRRMAEHPERVTRNDPSIARKVLLAAATSAAATLAKRFVQAQVRDVSRAARKG